MARFFASLVLLSIFVTAYSQAVITPNSDLAYNSTWCGYTSDQEGESGNWQYTLPAIDVCQSLFTWLATGHIVECYGAKGTAVLYLDASDSFLNVSVETPSANNNYTCSGLTATVMIPFGIVDDFTHGVWRPGSQEIASAVAAMCDIITPVIGSSHSLRQQYKVHE